MDLEKRLVERNTRAAEVYLEGVRKHVAETTCRSAPIVAVDCDIRGELPARITEDHVDLVVLSGHGRGGPCGASLRQRRELPAGARHRAAARRARPQRPSGAGRPKRPRSRSRARSATAALRDVVNSRRSGWEQPTGLESAGQYPRPLCTPSRIGSPSRFPRSRACLPCPHGSSDAHVMLMPKSPRHDQAAEWLMDNAYVIERAVRQIREDLPRGYFLRLPALATRRANSSRRGSMHSPTDRAGDQPAARPQDPSPASSPSTRRSRRSSSPSSGRSRRCCDSTASRRSSPRSGGWSRSSRRLSRSHGKIGFPSCWTIRSASRAACAAS